MTPFVDLGKKDEFSLKHALGNTKTIIPLLKERNQKYYAVSNYCEVSNWVQQLFACKAAGIIPILGMEAFVNNFRYATKEGVIYVQNLLTGEEKTLPEMDETSRDLVTMDYPIDLFAKTVEGYYNIIQIHNNAQLHGIDKRPRTSDDFIVSHGKGVVAVMPTPYSEVASLIYNRLYDEALEKYRYYEKIFDTVYLALTIVDDPEYKEINAEIIQFASKYDIPMIPVCNSHYHLPSDEEAFKTLKKLSKLRGGIFYEVDETPGMYYRTREEVDSLFRRKLKSPVFTEDVYLKSHQTLESLLEQFETLKIDTSLRLPKFDNGPEKLRERAWKGFLARGYDKKGKEYKDRFDYEIENIIGAGFADYFLILEEVFNWYRNDMHSLGAFGRGSAAGSLVLNCIGCTNVDPIKHNLLFERFLDAERFVNIVKSGGQVSGCFPGETVVKTKGGYEFISKIKKGDLIISYDGEIESVLEKINTGLKEFYKLVYRSPEDGNEYWFEVTNNHVFPVFRNSNIVELPVSQLVCNSDKLVLNKKENVFVDIREITYSRISEGYDLTISNHHYYRVCGRRLRDSNGLVRH